ncbi:GLPGLI family protein [Chishuiella changwenlii]|uniref:GLPGLI family protein n=1 Tax=Chishuiella changwenlii TaxID=1434701 RepID=UPI002FD9A783
MRLLYKLITCTTLFTSSIFAQKLEVKYQELMIVDKDDFKKSMKFESSTSSKLPSGFEDQVYKSMTEPKDYLLTIFDNESYYKKEEKISNNQSTGGFSISFSTSGAGEGLYKNIETKQYITNVSSFDKAFTIKDQLKNYDWKLSRETKKILGFDAKKATATVDSTTIVAWYAPSLAVKNGPGKYDGLPGLILETESQDSKDKMNGKTVIRVIEVKEVPDLKKIDKPKEKNVVTNDEFKKVMDAQSEKFKKMRSEGVDRKD